MAFENIPTKISIQKPSNKAFGSLLVILGIIFSIYAYKNREIILSFVAIFATFLILFITLKNPNVLNPLHDIWSKLSIILGKLTNPVILGFVFIIILTPLAILLRMAHRDLLKLKKTSSLSYWQDSHEISFGPNNFRNQF